MSLDIFKQTIAELRESQCFSLQLDESTDVAHCSQLVVYVRYINDSSIKEDFYSQNL